MRYNKKRLNNMIKRMQDANIGNYAIDSEEAIMERINSMTIEQKEDILQRIELLGLWPEPVEPGLYRYNGIFKTY